MKFIPTTATAVEKIKSLAREIKSIDRLAYSCAIEIAAKRNGYENWHHVIWCQKNTSSDAVAVTDLVVPCAALVNTPRSVLYMNNFRLFPVAEVIRHSIGGDFFHHAEIEGVHFVAGIANSGPYVSMLQRKQKNVSDGDSYLGVSKICYTEKQYSRDKEILSWNVCKYDSGQAKIDLDRISSAGVCAFSKEFGIAIDPHKFADHDQNWVGTLYSEIGYFCPSSRDLFYLSPAFASLQRWVERHPRKAGKYGPSPYVGDWVARAGGSSQH